MNMPIDRSRRLAAAVPQRVVAVRRPIDLSMVRRPMVGAVRASLAAGLAGAAWASASAVFGPSAAAIYAPVPLAVGILLVEIERAVRSDGGVFSRFERASTACGALAGTATVAPWIASAHLQLHDASAFTLAWFASVLVAAQTKRRTNAVAAFILSALAAPFFLLPILLHVAFLPPITVGLAIGWSVRTFARGRARLPLTLLSGLLAGATEALLMHARAAPVTLHPTFFTHAIPESLEDAGFAALAAAVAAAFAGARRSDAAWRILTAFSGRSRPANVSGRPDPIVVARVRKSLDRCEDDAELREQVAVHAARISASPAAAGAPAAHALLRERAARIEEPLLRVSAYITLVHGLPAGSEGAAHADLRARSSEIADEELRSSAYASLARRLPPGKKEAVRAWKDLCARTMLIENDEARESAIECLTMLAPSPTQAASDRD